MAESSRTVAAIGKAVRLARELSLAIVEAEDMGIQLSVKVEDVKLGQNRTLRQVMVLPLRA